MFPSSKADARPESGVRAEAQSNTSDADTLRALIAAACEQFNVDELRVVQAIVQRLAIGRQRYGALDLSKPRDWQREAAEEAADLIIYRAAGELAK